MCNNNSIFRIYECNRLGECNSEFLKIDLRIETENVIIEGVEQNIIRYIVINSGTQAIYGNIVIYSELFGRIVERDILLKDEYIIERIRSTEKENQEKCRAYFRVRNVDVWIYSKLEEINFDLPIVPEIINNINLLEECYVFAVMIRTVAVNGYRTTLRFANASAVDAINLRVIVNFDGTMKDLRVLQNGITPFSDYTQDGQMITFSYPVFPARDTRIYELFFISSSFGYKTFAEVVIRTDNPNGNRNLDPNISVTNNF